MSDIIIRNAAQTDHARLLELRQEQHAILQQLDPRLTVTAPTDNYTNTPERRVVVALRNNTILGYVIGEVQAAKGVIYEMVIDAHIGSRGVGTALLNALTDWFKDNSLQTFTVNVPRHHAVQQAFWRAKGAAVIAANPEKRTETMQITLKERE